MIPSATIIRGAIALMRVVPVPLARGMAAIGGLLAWLVMRERRDTLLLNLSFTAPGRTSAERRRLARRTFHHMAVSAVDLFRLPSMTPDALRDLIEVRGLEHLDASQALGKGTVLVTAHLGPYELASAWIAARGYPIHGMIEDLAPDVLDALATYRSATGVQLMNIREGLRGAYRVLNQGRVLAIIADRVVGDTRSGVAMPLGAGTRLMPTGPAVLSQGTGAPIVIGFITRHPQRHPRYLIEIDPPILPAGRDAGERDRLMTIVADRISRAVQRSPDQWFVFQPNWVSGEPA